MGEGDRYYLAPAYPQKRSLHLVSRRERIEGRPYEQLYEGEGHAKHNTHQTDILPR